LVKITKGDDILVAGSVRREVRRITEAEGDVTSTSNLIMRWLRFIIALCFVSFQLYTAAKGILAPLLQRGIHLLFALMLTFSTYSTKKEKHYSKPDVFTIMCFVLSILFCGYVSVNHVALWQKFGVYSRFEVILSVVGFVVILESVRRVIGAPLIYIVLLSVLYALFGYLLPPIVASPPLSIERIITHSAMTLEGFFGIALGVSATYVFMFILFAVILQNLGGGQTFLDVANALMGHCRGGAAKVAVMASAFFATLSGSGVANTAATGSFTIPLMKKTGYSAEDAAAIEVSSSAAGQVTPPVMGASAFIMAEVIGVPYWTIAFSAILPAVLYYISIFTAVDVKAAQANLKGIPKEQRPQLRKVLREGWQFLLSPALLVYLMLVVKWSPMRSIFFSSIVLVATYFVDSIIKKEFSLSTVTDFLLALESGAKTTLSTATACAAVGVVIGVIGLTGIGIRFSGMLTTLAGGNMFLLLFLTMIASLILGMGLPTVAAYMILAILVAPAMVKLGAHPISAHLFVFYYGILSVMTPPLMLAVFVASSIAESDPLKTSYSAMKIASVVIIIPYMFVYNPALIGIGTVQSIATSMITAIIGVLAFALGINGYIIRPASPIERTCLMVGAILLMLKSMATDIVGIGLVVVALGIHASKKKKQALEDRLGS